jgi:hypothetical protein
MAQKRLEEKLQTISWVQGQVASGGARIFMEPGQDATQYLRIV